jgi:hypothetical protein
MIKQLSDQEKIRSIYRKMVAEYELKDRAIEQLEMFLINIRRHCPPEVQDAIDNKLNEIDEILRNMSK